MNRLTILSLAGLLALLVLPAQVFAQGVRLDRYSAPMTGDDGLQLNRPIALGHQRWSASLTLEHADDPLVLRLAHGGSDNEAVRLVDHQLVGQARFAYGLFDRLVFGVGLDVVLAMKGDEHDPPTGSRLDPADGAGLGDLRFGVRYVPFGDRDSVGQVAVQAHLIVPTAEIGPDQNLRGERSVAFAPEVLGEVRAPWFRVSANVGAVVRKDAELAGVDLGDEVTFGLGVGVPLPFLPTPIELMAEVFGSTRVGDFFGSNTTPVEALFGARWKPVEAWRVSLGAGPGLQEGIGAPDVRVLANAAYVAPAAASPAEPAEAPPVEPAPVVEPEPEPEPVVEPEPEPEPEPEAEPEPEPEPDADGDGVSDADDACPDVPGSVEAEGCPEAVEVDDEQIRIRDRIEFAVGGADLLPSSEPILEAIRETLEENPQLERVAVVGHTDDSGPARVNSRLSRERAQSVTEWLTDRGVAAERLVAWGCGPSQPLGDNATEAGRQANRRVELRILEPAPEASPSFEGCTPAE